ncbi:transcriptional regulator NrdR [Candidatus Woesearchaeota archaeon]|nr:transcriptional regulator NrdR [Candidatus Woesearchaeota archaeon]
MKCPYCSNTKSSVINKRNKESIVRRRRECLKCKKRFTTYERADIALSVIKKNGTREPYNREKIRGGLLKACEKRQVNNDDINDVVDKVENKLRQLKNREIKTKLIGEEIMKHLKRLDKVAYIRFASVYREFKDIDDFEKEIKKIEG